jgi:hypothetical protein
MAGVSRAALLERARHCLSALAALPLPATGYANTHGFRIAADMAVGIDLLWDALPADERAALVGALVVRAREFHRLSVGVALVGPRDSHAVVYGIAEMAKVALALQHHCAEATDWLADLLLFFRDAFPGMGGRDGGWCQGFGYGDGMYQETLHLLEHATGLQLWRLPWARANGRWFLYCQPPYSTLPTFGDAGYNRPSALQRRVLEYYARVYGPDNAAPHLAWHALQLEEGAPAPSAFELSFLLRWPHLPAPASPEGVLPPSCLMADLGWVAMRSAWAEDPRARGELMLLFKSSAFGSYSHSHADQNSCPGPPGRLRPKRP